MEREEMNELLSAIGTMMDTKLEPIKQRLDKLELTIENETNKNIKLLAEGHTGVVDRLNKLENKVEDVQDTVSVLKILTKSLQNKQ